MGSHFESLAKAVIKSQGLPDFPMVIVPEDLEDRSDEELRKMAPEYFELFLEKLGILVQPD